MRLNIKTVISIIVIAVSSISFVQAGDHRSSRDHDRSVDRSHSRSDDNQRHYRQGERRHQWKRSTHRSNHYRAPRHYNRSHGYNPQHRVYRSHNYRHTIYMTPRYVAPHYVAPSHYSHNVVVTSSGHALPILAGGLIGSAIASDASNGDPIATFGGAVFGAIIGNAIAHH